MGWSETVWWVRGSCRQFVVIETSGLQGKCWRCGCRSLWGVHMPTERSLGALTGAARRTVLSLGVMWLDGGSGMLGRSLRVVVIRRGRGEPGSRAQGGGSRQEPTNAASQGQREGSGHWMFRSKVTLQQEICYLVFLLKQLCSSGYLSTSDYQLSFSICPDTGNVLLVKQFR